MKKNLILTSICLVAAMSLSAQDAGGQRQGRQPRRMTDAVVDTTIINHMGIDAAVLQQVYALQESKKTEQQELLKNSRPEKGTRMTEEQRKEMLEKREAFTAQYRKQLRALMGDENYILYLEKQVDRQGVMRPGMPPRGNMQGQRQGGGQRQDDFGGGSDF